MEDSLPERLGARARLTPEEPWLFYFSNLDWRWLSFAEVHAAVTATAVELDAALGAAGVDRGGSVAFSDRRSAASVMVDLALQAAGRVPLPIPREGAGGPAYPDSPPAGPPAAWVELPLWPPQDEQAFAGAPPARWEKLPRIAPRIPPVTHAGSGPGTGPQPSGACRESPHLVCATAAGWVDVPAADVLAAAEGLAARIAAQRPPKRWPRREISVLAEPLASAQGRLQLAWSLHAGAAVLLEPDAFAFAATAAWARPTLLFGDAERAAAVARRLEDEHRPRRWWHLGGRDQGPPRGLPWGRLWAWVLPAAGARGGAAQGALEARGVRLVVAPSFLAA